VIAKEFRMPGAESSTEVPIVLVANGSSAESSDSTDSATYPVLGITWMGRKGSMVLAVSRAADGERYTRFPKESTV